MAVEAFLSTQRTPDLRLRPIDKHGKFRIAFFMLPATTVTGDIGTTIELTDLPPGAVRVLPHLSRITNSAWGAARTLAVGHRAYQKSSQNGGVDEAQNASAFAAAIDMSAAVTTPAALGTALKYDLYSLAGVVVYATVAGGTIPTGATLNGYIAYIYE